MDDKKNQFPPNAPDLKICQQYCAALNGAKGAEWYGRWLHGDRCGFDEKQRRSLEGQLRFSKER